MNNVSTTSDRLVIAKCDIHTIWGVIPAGSIGSRVSLSEGEGRHFIDFGLRYPITAFYEEVRDASPLEVLAAQLG